MKPLCDRLNCDDPACRREHMLVCVSCHLNVSEDDAALTKEGYMHEDCAEEMWPEYESLARELRMSR